jgi:hypothetical protein
VPFEDAIHDDVEVPAAAEVVAEVQEGETA